MINQGLAETELIGNLVAAPEITMAGDTPKAKMRLAVNESWTKDGEKQEHVSYFSITVWGKRGQACADHLIQGQQVVVLGRLRQERFPDKDTGETVSYIHIIAREVIFGDKPKGADQATSNDSPAQVAEPAATPESETEESPF